MRASILPFVVLLLYCAYAQPDVLEQIEVKATQQKPQTGKVILSETTGASSLISGDALTRPGSTLSQVLARQAGTQVRQSGGLGSYSSATLRGSSSDQVMIYLDGLLLNDASGGAFNLSNIELMQADAIEVYRGATPMQLNKASLGGAINIRSKPADGEPMFRATVSGGSFNTQQLGVFGNGTLGRFDTLLSANLRRSDNDFAFHNNNGTRFNPNDDFDDHRKNAEVEQSSLLLKLGNKSSTTSQQDISLQYFLKNQNIPDWKNTAYNTASLDTQTARLQLSHHKDSFRQTAWNTRLGFNLSRSVEEYFDGQSRIGLGRQHDQWTSHIVGLNNYWEYVSDQRTFSLSADYRQENYDAEDLLNVKPDSTAKRHEWTLALQQSLFFYDQRLLLTPALRYQQLEDNFKIINHSITENGLSGAFSHHNLAPQFGVKYQLYPVLSINSNVGQYQRVPSFFELFGDRGLFTGNDELTPESGINFDVGVSWHSSSDHNLLQKPSAQISIFYNDVDDAITRTYNSRGIGKSVNIEGALMYGLEWELSTRIHKNTKIQFKGTVQNTENRSPVPAFKGKQLSGQAKQSYSLYLDHKINHLKLYYEFLGKTNRYYDTANLLPAADQAIHNIGFKYRHKHSELSIELNNISDDIYEDFNGFPKPGRALFFTFNYFGE